MQIIFNCFFYGRYSPSIRAEIGRYAEIRGCSAASLYFTRKLGHKVSTSTVYTIKMDYLAEKKKSDEEPCSLPVKKRGRPLLLGDAIEVQLQAYIHKGAQRPGGSSDSCCCCGSSKGHLEGK